MFYFKDEDRYVGRASAISNMVRARFSGISLDKVFIHLSQWDSVPLCPICNDRPRKLKSMLSGFRPTCETEECRKHHSRIQNIKIGKKKEYKTLWKTLLEEKESNEEHLKCPVCERDYLPSKTASAVCCGRRKCFMAVRSGYAGGKEGRADLIIDCEIELHNKAISIFLDEKDRYKTQMALKVHCRDKSMIKKIMIPNKEGDLDRMSVKRISSGLLIPIIPWSTYVRRLYHWMNLGDKDGYEEFMISEFPEAIKRCPYCQRITHISPSGVIERSENLFCDRSHYDLYRRDNPDIYFVQTEIEKKKASERMIKKIQDGTFTPNTTNSWTRSDPLIIDGIAFKSSWESLFYRVMRGRCDLAYEKVRIPYTDDEGVVRNYITDFVDIESGNIFEVKPESQMSRRLNLIKIAAAKEWAKCSGVNFFLVHEDWFIEKLPELTLLEASGILERKEIKAIEKFRRMTDV